MIATVAVVVVWAGVSVVCIIFEDTELPPPWQAISAVIEYMAIPVTMRRVITTKLRGRFLAG
jgi:hypothetical protein